MPFQGRTGRFFGRYVLGLYFLGHALAHVSGQVAPSDRSLPAAAAKTDQSIAIPLGFVQRDIPHAMTGVPYRSSVEAIGGTGFYELSVTGDLPPGFSAETGGSTVTFGGVPAEAGTYGFQVTIRDIDGTSFRQDFSIRVFPRVLGAVASRNAVVADSEMITMTDAVSVFFPVHIVDYETITLTDAESGMDAAVVADKEDITTTDTITIAVLTVPRIYWTNPAPITYGTPLSATQLNATGGVDGTLTYTPPAGTVLTPGQHTLSVTLTPNNTTEYAPATDTVTITVNQAAQAITFTPPTSPVTFPVSPMTLSATGGASGNPVVFSIVSGPGTVSGTNGSTLTITNVGTVVIAANQAGNTDYTAAPQVTQSIVVNAPAIAALVSPTPGLGTTLGTTNVVFTWTTAVGATDYQLNLSAIGPGQSELFLYKGTATTATAATLPANGAEVYATLYSKIGGVWQSNSYVYYESGPRLAALTSPTPGLGTILGTSNVTFNWTTGAEVADYQLNLSAIASGDSDLYSYKGTATTATVPTLPANGVKVYATLYSKINGVWQSNSYSYTESGTPTPATLTSPNPGLGTILGATNVVFQWTPGVAVTDYQLSLSSVAPGDSELFLYKGTATTATAPTLPANALEVYARLYSKINGVWQYNDYVYTESGTPTPAALTSPTPGLGTILGTSNVTFQWSTGIGVTDYQLNLSAVAAGDSELYSYKGTALTTTASTLPANGVKVYARLYSKINGIWQYNDYQYTEQ